MTDAPSVAPLPEVNVVLTRGQVFQSDDRPDEPFFTMNEWPSPVIYLVGRNGSGKSRSAKIIANLLNGKFESTDRLAGLIPYQNYGWGSIPTPESSRGMPLGTNERAQARSLATQSGSGADDMFALKDQPEVWLRVAAFLRRAFGRVVELRETAGM